MIPVAPFMSYLTLSCDRHSEYIVSVASALAGIVPDPLFASWVIVGNHRAYRVRSFVGVMACPAE